MSFKGVIRWGLRPKRIGILLAKLVLATTTELAAQTSSYPSACGECLILAVASQHQSPMVRTMQQTAARFASGDIATRLR